MTHYPERSYLIDQIIPTNSVNLLGGSSGSGKSRISFQSMYEIQSRKTLFGYRCLQPIVQQYIAYDRILESIWDTLNTMHIDLDDLPISSYVLNHPLTLPTPSIITPGCNLLWVDGVECFTDKIIEFHRVAQIVKIFLNLAITAQVSIIALMGMAKFKANDKYVNSREELIGSTAWGRFADTIFTLGSDGDNITDQRILKILPRNGPAVVKNLTFDSLGHLVPSPTTSPNTPPSIQIVEEIFINHPGMLPTCDIVGYATDAGISERSAKEAIAILLSKHKIKRVQYGIYTLA